MPEHLINQMEDTDVKETSVVDQPATGRSFGMFKRGAARQGKQKADLVDLERCLEQHPDADPAWCEAMAASSDVPPGPMEPDREGDDSTVEDPVTAGDFAMPPPAGGKQQKPAEVEACVASMLADPEFDAGEFGSREERAFAVCQSQAARLGGPRMPRKQEEVPLEPAPEEAPIGAEAVEIPTSAQKWPFVQCIADAGAMGADDQNAAMACMMIRERYGDPNDQESIRLPDGLTPDSVLTQALIDAGTLKPEGAGSEEAPAEVAAEQALRAPGKPGKNIWAAKFAAWMGWDKESPVERMERRLMKEVEAVRSAQEKKTSDLLQIIAQQQRIISGAIGIDPDRIFGAYDHEKPVAAVPAAQVLAAEAPAAEVAAADPAKRSKDEPPQTMEELLAANQFLQEQNAALTATLQGVELVEEEDEEETEISPGFADRVDEVLEEATAGQPLAVMEPAVGCAHCASTPKRFQRKVGRRQSKAPQTKARGGTEMVSSTFLGGLKFPKLDRKELGWS